MSREITGVQAINKLRANHYNFPIYLISGGVHRQELAQLKIQSFMDKSAYDPDKLIKEISDYLI